jgi:hypothetical protein
MKPLVIQGAMALVCALSASACGGQSEAGLATSADELRVDELEALSRVVRTYLGAEQVVPVGPKPVVGTFDLVGGARIDVEIAARDGAPLRFELWQTHVDGWATLVWTLDVRSGFALRELEATEDSSWVLRFPAAAPADVVVSITCLGRSRCAPRQQPGETCPAGWECDQGLTCRLPGAVCQP